MAYDWDKYRYMSPGAMAILQGRRAFSTGADTDPQEPPEYGLPPPSVTPVPTPVPPQAPDYTQRAIGRANREREFLAANPGRRAGPMGRKPDGSIDYDLTTVVGTEALARIRREQEQRQRDQWAPAGPQRDPNAVSREVPNPTVGWTPTPAQANPMTNMVPGNAPAQAGLKPAMNNPPGTPPPDKILSRRLGII